MKCKWLLIVTSIVVTGFGLVGCKNKNGKTDSTQKVVNDSIPEIKDAHSYSNFNEVRLKHLDLTLDVNFSGKELKGKAVWDIEQLKSKGVLKLDIGQLYIQHISFNDDSNAVNFEVFNHDNYKGNELVIPLKENTKRITITYAADSSAKALQWLSSEQTLSKQPFLFTQSQAILARTWIPCQDAPNVRFTYEATVKVPQHLIALMSAENPYSKNDSGIYHFKQTRPIPSYLMALAVGDIKYQKISENTGVYAEPQMLGKASKEFEDMGKMMAAAESIYGKYQWGRFDVLVLPFSFPYGGMENPNLTFATPTIITGDKSLVAVVAHELAHSWSGNLVTNATWNDGWLNEGFTTYFERRIIEKVYGQEEMLMQEAIGYNDLKASLNTGYDKLKGDYDNIDPDDIDGSIAYDKGYAFLKTLELFAARDSFDLFLNKWFRTYAYQSRTTEQFEAFLNTNLLHNDKATAGKLEIKKWLYESGIPANAYTPKSRKLEIIDSVAASINKNLVPASTQPETLTTTEALYFINALSDSLPPATMQKIDNVFNFTNSNNAEVQALWYVLALKTNYEKAWPAIQHFIATVGRRKFIFPIYKAMKPEVAKREFEKNKKKYHSVVKVSLENYFNTIQK
ncbi:M1 family metallopeptidase [Polluticaenibacter yanchengensis]|uniref:Aminopeptidase N n=1 Tax=Polluticaenibacter yanchengensis TaxID=3014562 RepID=A0ABT4UFE8_9BACT|nr:M1 family metallopeptidase [Chitinophagaceae bacterium LY-5]